MSRKREHKKERDKELARQLGDDAELAGKLAERPRVTDVELHLQAAEAEKRGLSLGKPAVGAAVFVIDAQGPRRVLAATWSLKDALPSPKATGQARYTRPAHFVLLVLAAKSAAALKGAFAAADAPDRLGFVLDGGAVPLADRSLASARWESGREVGLQVDGETATKLGAWARSFGGVHRERADVDVALPVGGARWKITLGLRT